MAFCSARVCVCVCVCARTLFGFPLYSVSISFLPFLSFPCSLLYIPFIFNLFPFNPAAVSERAAFYIFILPHKGTLPLVLFAMVSNPGVPYVSISIYPAD